MEEAYHPNSPSPVGAMAATSASNPTRIDTDFNLICPHGVGVSARLGTPVSGVAKCTVSAWGTASSKSKDPGG